MSIPQSNTTRVPRESDDQDRPAPRPRLTLRDQGSAVRVTNNGRAKSAESSKGNTKPSPSFGLLP